MEFNLVKIENSFNKKTGNTHQENIIGKNSTLNKNFEDHTETNSMGVTSLTNSAVSHSLGIAKNDTKEIKRKALIREIFIGAMGTIIGSIIVYLILGVK